MAGPRLQTNLIGQKVHIITDEEARAEATRMGCDATTVATLSATGWFPVLSSNIYQSLRGVTGEIRQIHLDKDCHPVYLVAFDNQLMTVPIDLLRLGTLSPEE